MADGELEETEVQGDAPTCRSVPAEGARGRGASRSSENGWIGIHRPLLDDDADAAVGAGLHRGDRSTRPRPTSTRPTRGCRWSRCRPAAPARSTTWLFAGAKVWSILRDYQDEKPINGFVDAIDWGWFFFLTKPIFRVLHEMHKLIGNMGLAIIGLTFVIKLHPLPAGLQVLRLDVEDEGSCSREMEKIKERVGDDRMKMQQEMMALYKREKVNPAAGCLPILLQIPIFFSLYKVIFVTIELRHAPFFGWIQDLSAPDPTSVLNLFGLLPWAAPGPTSVARRSSRSASGRSCSASRCGCSRS